MTGVTEIRGAITGVTTTNPVVVTSNAHGLSNNDQVRIAEVGGVVEANNQRFRLFNVTTNTFELQDPDNHDQIDGTDFTTYTTGGRWNRVNRINSDRIFFNP